MIAVGIDVGGTFTDFVVFDGKSLRTHKVLSTPEDPGLAVEEGLRELKLPGRPVIVHGCTLATNAFLERKGARTALLTTKGFEDLLEIGRQDRPRLYDLAVTKDPPLVPRSRRLGIDERVGADGRILRKLRIPRLDLRGAESVAICLLHSYLRPEHERALARRLKVPVSVSSELLPEYREYERLATTVLNAYVMPVMDRYLRRLERRVAARELRIMVSGGGQLPAKAAAKAPVHTILSGPAGGAIAVEAVCRTAGIPRALAFDMGGTSTDVCLYDGGLSITKEGSLGGYPVRVPLIEIHTVGIGGGSIARADAGGILRVGPESAKSDPGPACYGRGGTRPTVTDANLLLGRIDPTLFFGGKLELDVHAAYRAMEGLAKRLRRSIPETSRAVLEVAGAQLDRAVRAVSVERGHDPARFVLVPFGGAGALHACDLAERLALPRILVPRWPGLLSALGMLLADEVTERSAPVLAPLADRAAVERAFRATRLRGERWVDLRYEGQSHELRVPWSPGVAAEFRRRHEARFGYARDAAIEVVNAGVRRRVAVRKPELPRIGRGGRRWKPGIVMRAHLRSGDRLAGPSFVMEDNASTFLKEGWAAVVDPRGHLDLRRTR